MREEIRAELARVLDEAIGWYDRENVSDDALARCVRDHILNRWYRFAPFGVTSRAELAPIKVVISWSTTPARELAAQVHGVYIPPARRTSVHLHGTPLASKPGPDGLARNALERRDKS